MKSRKPIAEKFQDWVSDMVTEVRLTGKYELDKNTEQQKKLIEQQTKSNTLIEHYNSKRIVYLGMVEECEDYDILKYGCTKDIKESLNRHKKSYGDSFYYLYALECDKHDELERKIQTHNV